MEEILAIDDRYPQPQDFGRVDDPFAYLGAPGSPERLAASRQIMQADIARFEVWNKQLESVKYRPKGPVWDVSWPTYIESWPNALHSLSVPSTRVKLTLEEARVLGSYIAELGEGFTEGVPENHEWIRDHIIERLEKASQLYDCFFVRLGSRSPKDAMYWGFSGDNEKEPLNGQLKTGLQAFYLLTACSERICDDLHMQIAMNYEPSIWLRQGIDLPEWSEYRCFMEDRKLVGMSQYYYREPYPEIISDAGGIKWAIEQFFDKEFRNASHLDSIVFDVFVKRHLTGTQNWSPKHEIYSYEVKLLEVNPFYNLSDPCLFDWNHPEEFKGQLRFRTELGGHRVGVTDV